MNALDIILGFILGGLLIRGIFRGLVKETASLLGLILGFFLANAYSMQLAPKLAFLPFGPSAINLTAYLGIIFGTVLTLVLVGKIVRKILQLITLGWLDHLGGGLVGLLKGLLLSSIIVLALTTFLPTGAELLTRSQIAPYINSFNSLLSKALSEDMRAQFTQRRQALQMSWDSQMLNGFDNVQELFNEKK